MSRTLTIFFACLLSLAGLFAAPARLAAQAAPPPYCQLLSPADCDLLQAAHTAMSTLQAGASSSTLTLQAERIPEMPPATLSIQVDAAARFAAVSVTDLFARGLEDVRLLARRFPVESFDFAAAERAMPWADRHPPVSVWNAPETAAG